VTKSAVQAVAYLLFALTLLAVLVSVWVVLSSPFWKWPIEIGILVLGIVSIRNRLSLWREGNR
jgi:hypothetical protein